MAGSYPVVRENVRSRVLTARETAEVVFREVAREIVVHRREISMGFWVLVEEWSKRGGFFRRSVDQESQWSQASIGLGAWV